MVMNKVVSYVEGQLMKLLWSSLVKLVPVA